MKRFLSLFILLFMIFSTVSCSDNRSADELLSAFLSAYPAEGIVYSPSRAEGEEGYIDRALFERIYVSFSAFPDNFAIFLNSHTDSRAECAVFVCESGAELSDLYEMCEERLRLLGARDNGFIIRSDMTLFYSAMPDKARAQKIWRKVIG